MSAGKKILLGGISAILLVGVVIGVVGFAVKSNHSVGDDISMPSNGGVNSVSKGIEGVCQPTDYKEACVKSLGGALGNNVSNPNPKDVVKAAVQVTVDGMKEAYQKAQEITKAGAPDAMHKAALGDCEELLQYAIGELQDALSISSDGKIEPKDLSARADDLKNWLSAVISYQDTCLDGLNHPELKTAMQNGLTNATQLTSNALAIVTELSKLVEGLGDALNKDALPKATGSRRLLGAAEESYPNWLSAGDRKLLAAPAPRVRPNAVVAKDGSGQFKTITAALKAMPRKSRGRYVIYVKAGIYKENVIVEKDMVNVFMYGDGARKSIVTGSKNFVDGTPTYQTATFAAIGNGFIAKDMGFSNTAGPAKHQAVALRVQSDMSAFYNCRMDAYQDTLYAQTHRQFYRNCVISGTVDFIFGDASCIIQNCLLIVRRPMDNQQCIVTAQGRTDKRESTGIVIQNCRIVPEQKLFAERFKIATYLGRPWKQYSRTVIMESLLADFIRPEGFMPWEGDFALNTLFYAEYANRGPGANTARRVRWRGYKVITNRNEAMTFTVGPFIQGNMWLRYTGIPYILGLKR